MLIVVNGVVHWEKHNCSLAKTDSFSLKIENCGVILRIKKEIFFKLRNINLNFSAFS